MLGSLLTWHQINLDTFWGKLICYFKIFLSLGIVLGKWKKKLSSFWENECLLVFVARKNAPNLVKEIRLMSFPWRINNNILCEPRRKATKKILLFTQAFVEWQMKHLSEEYLVCSGCRFKISNVKNTPFVDKFHW